MEQELELFEFDALETAQKAGGAGKDVLMTTTELAEALNVKPRTVQRTAEKLATVQTRVLTNSQGGYLFTQEQATLIKKEIQRHHNLKSRQIDGVKSELEILGNAREAMADLAKLYASAAKRAEALERENAELLPKAEFYDGYLSQDGLYSFTDAARAIGCTRARLMKLLKGKFIYETPNAKYGYRCYTEYRDLFRMRPYSFAGGRGFQLMLTVRGLEKFARIIRKEDGE